MQVYTLPKYIHKYTKSYMFMNMNDTSQLWSWLCSPYKKIQEKNQLQLKNFLQIGTNAPFAFRLVCKVSLCPIQQALVHKPKVKL